MSTFNVKVEYDMMPIRHIAVECPRCKRWFRGGQITKDSLAEHYDIYNAKFICPLCKEEFGYDLYNDKKDTPNIEESGYPDIYKDCLTKKEIWE